MSPSSPKDTVLVSSVDAKVRLLDRSNGEVRQREVALTEGTADVLWAQGDVERP